LFVETICRRAEQRGGFGGIEAEVARSDLAHSSADAQATQAEWWVRAGDEDHGQLPRAQVDEALDPFVYDGFVDEVIVVEDHHEPLRERRQLVDQRGHDRVARAQGADHHWLEALTDLRVGVPDRGRDGHPEPGWIGVRLLQLQPRDGARMGGCPAGDEGRLSGPCGCADQHERHGVGMRAVEHCPEANTIHQACRRRRRLQFGGRQVVARLRVHPAEHSCRSPG
jgi:hypothetical protein